MMWGGGDGWGWIGGVLMMVLFWGGLIALVVFLVRGLGSRPQNDGRKQNRPDASQILEERFARGEIAEEEFEQRSRVLERRPR